MLCNRTLQYLSKMSMNKDKLDAKAWLLGLFTTTLWGMNFLVIDLGLRQLDPFLLTFLRFFFCAVPLVFFIKKPQGISWAVLFLYGSLFACGLWWVVNFAIHQGLSVGLSALFLQFSAFFTIILGVMLFKERINRIQITGMVLAFFGLVFLIYHKNTASTLQGIGLILLAALAWAVCNSIIKRYKPSDMIAFIVWSSLCSLPALFVMTLWVKGVDLFINLPSQMNAEAWFSVLFQAYITTIVGYMIWNNLMRQYPVSQVAPLSLIVPIVGAVSSYLLLNEPMDMIKVTAIIIVLLGLGIFMNANKIKQKSAGLS
ncbi:EamA family transporter [Moraxella cuniculi]|uniref:Probable amino-acid metabolite efflux pump n=1 Tax=Moraxella cuniculi TaxID=34061 RepID=A0A448GWG7_9GAMM|nr:EamA family transporter [Moraxella cuniculi]VEG13143.1 Probable amino-acid metabolite efflux pump [Moraxella cuniculi]